MGVNMEPRTYSEVSLDEQCACTSGQDNLVKANE